MHVVGVEFVVVAMALFAGAIVQGSLGFGMVLVMFPVLVIAEPELLPQTRLIVALPMMLGLAWRHRGGAVWREVGLVTLGRPRGIDFPRLRSSCLRGLLRAGGDQQLLSAIQSLKWREWNDVCYLVVSRACRVG